MPTIEKLIITVIAAQIAAPLSVFLLKPGFDKENSIGLDFDFVVQMGFCFVILWLVGFGLSLVYRNKKKLYFFIELGLSPLFLALLFGGYSLYLK